MIINYIINPTTEYTMTNEKSPSRLDTLSQVHGLLGLPKPQHPLISLIYHSERPNGISPPQGTHVLNFYKISFSQDISGKVKYGHGYYDFDDGGLLFAAPNQIIGDNNNESAPEITLLFHPDFLLGFPLAKKIKQYTFFSYSVRESLHLSNKEKETFLMIVSIINDELNNRIDEFSHDIVVGNIELLLNYCNRFYKRQFITRKIINTEIISKVDDILEEYFENNSTLFKGLPTVQYLSNQLHITPGYLSDLLRAQIGQNAQQYIQHKFIEKAKEKLTTTNLSVGEIAFELGYKHSQSFSKLFKSRTGMSPIEFRISFN